MTSHKVTRAVIARSEGTKQSSIISYLPRRGLLSFARSDEFFTFCETVKSCPKKIILNSR
jgi:hypothetical protein